MKISFLVSPGVPLLDAVGPSDIFAEANRQLGTAHYELEVVSCCMEPIIASSGWGLPPHRNIQSPDAEIDTLLITGWPTGVAVEAAQELLDWVKRQAPRVRRLGGICRGSYVLASAGLLDGRTITTHWA